MCIWFQSDSKSRRFEGLRTFSVIIIIITIITGGKQQERSDWGELLLFFLLFFFFLPGTVGRRKQEQHCQVMVTAWAFDQRISVWHVVAIG